MTARRKPPPLAAPSGELLGTPIHALDLGWAREVVFVSDLHLRPELEAATAAFAELLGEVADGQPVLVMGDLFDFWVGRSQLRCPAWQRVPELLAGAARRGVQIYVLHGNRDYQLDPAFERATGARVVAGGLLVTLPGGSRLVCLHGDELCLDDTGYQRAKRWLRSPPVRFLLHRLPFFVANRLAMRARRASGRQVAMTDPSRLRPAWRALAAVRGLGAADLLFGHVHRAAGGLLPGPDPAGRFRVLPAFDAESRGHARFTRTDGLRLSLGGRWVDWPPAEGWLRETGDPGSVS